jgi:hypothetical protein
VAIGTALFIAPIIAVGIERWMTKRIARDVFRASLGYSMPPHFKNEILRIADQKLICTRHVMWVNMEMIENDNVRVGVIFQRTIKNIGPGDQEFPGVIHIDDWGFAEQSKIHRFEITAVRLSKRCLPIKG